MEKIQLKERSFIGLFLSYFTTLYQLQRLGNLERDTVRWLRIKNWENVVLDYFKMLFRHFPTAAH